MSAVELPDHVYVAGSIWPNENRMKILATRGHELDVLREFQVFTIRRLGAAFREHKIWTAGEILEVLQAQAETVDKHMSMLYR